MSDKEKIEETTDESNTDEVITEAVNVDSVIKSLADLNWEEDPGKAAELLKGLAHAEDPKSDAYMKKLSAAASKIAGVSESEEEESEELNEEEIAVKKRHDSVVGKANDFV